MNRKHQRSTTARGYGHTHEQRRKQLAPLVRTGTINCARCHQPIQPGAPWALDHDDNRNGYLGPGHALCNSRAGAAKTNGNRRDGLPVSRVISQRLVDDPEPGTVVYVDNDHADYYDGHQWRNVRRRDLAL